MIPPERGKPDIHDAKDQETDRLSSHPQFLNILERSRARLKAEGGIAPDEMRRRLGLAK